MSCFYSTKVKILPLSESRAEAIRLLSAAANRSQRSSVAYSPEFVRSPTPIPDAVVPDTSPLARLIQGGRGGGTRLRLYLLLTMIATGAPFDIRNPPTAMTLARTLDLPADTGPRRITSNMKWLADNQFIKLTRRPGQTPSIQLLDPEGERQAAPPRDRQADGQYPPWALREHSHRVLEPWLAGVPVSRGYRGPARAPRVPRRLESAPVHAQGPPGKLRTLP